MTMDEDVDDVTSAKLCSPEVSVRRCLFERPDADTTRRDLERALTELQQGSTVMWNFDFDRQRPVAGRIVWTRDGSVWVGKMSADSEAQRDSSALSVPSIQSAARNRKRRRRVDHTHTAGVMKSCRQLTQRQSRVTGSYSC